MNKKSKMSVGYIYFKSQNDSEDKFLIKELQKKLDVVLLPFEEQINFDTIKLITKKCNVIINNTVSEPVTFESVELSKTFEELGKKVINSSHSLYYQEDKWMFYLKCLEHKLPTPKTYLIPRETKYNSTIIKDLLNNREIVLKAIFSDNGECVERVDNYPDFVRKLKKIMDKNKVSPIIAQEFVPNSNRCYRATLFNYKLEQFIAKIGKSWKQTGSGKNEHMRSQTITPEIKSLCERAAKAFGIEICGLDLVKHKNKWYLIEVNSSPGLDFIYAEETKLTKKLSEFIYSVCKKYEPKQNKKSKSKK